MHGSACASLMATQLSLMWAWSDRDAATEATSKNVQNRNDHARIYSPRKRQRAVQTRTGASQRRTALLKYLGWGDRHTLHTTVASSRAGVRCGTQLVRTGHPACSIDSPLGNKEFPNEKLKALYLFPARAHAHAHAQAWRGGGRRRVAARVAARGGAWRRVAGD